MQFRFTAIGFIFGVLVTSTLFYFFSDPIQNMFSVIEQTLGEKMDILGKQLQHAGKGMKN